MKHAISLLRFGLFGFFLATFCFGDPLISTGALWRWRAGTSEASNPIDTWRSLGFKDATFTNALGPFWYGDRLEGGTELLGMQGVYNCLFLRKTFVVTNLAEINGLRLEALVDDGFVAWINGTEVLRVNMPGETGSPVLIGSAANNALEPVAFTSYSLATPKNYLIAGTNVLAVQVFQSNLNSSDIGFDASLNFFRADTLRPTLVEKTPFAGSNLDHFSSISLRFSEPVSGVVAAHLRVNEIGATSVTTIDDTTFVFNFTQPPYGPVTVSWNSLQTIADRADPPNSFTHSGLDSVWSYFLIDQTAPILVGTVPSRGATVRALDSVTVLFSEPVQGVEAADLQINGIPATGLSTLAASQYLFTFPTPPAGIVQITWSNNHGITDQALKPNSFANSDWTLRHDPNALEARPYISEFMASNTRTLKDETGQYSDWIELFNPSDATLDLKDWALTDSLDDLKKWRFPSTNLPPGGFLVVFTSGANRRLPGLPLHTNFQLSAGGEFLALVRPDGVTLASAFSPAYPRQLPDVSYGSIQVPRGNSWDLGTQGVYFLQPTPRSPNAAGTALPGPIIDSAAHQPLVPTQAEELQLTTRVRASFQSVGGVALHYRVQFGAEITVPMFDDGLHGDDKAEDGLFGTTIPAGVATPGQMIRYRITATDSKGASSRLPLFTHPTSTEEYFGTLVQPTNFVTRLPVFHLFVAPGQLSGIDSEGGGRVSFFHDGEFYDNIYMELRGNTSAGLNKKSHRLEFNRGHALRHANSAERTRKSALLAEYLDPAYLRQHLCFWLLNQMGDPAPFHAPIRVQMNGQFYQLAFHGDVIGQEQVERLGYDPRGALYKAVGNLVTDFSSTGVFQKLEPDGEVSRTDYLQLASGIRESSSVTVRRNTVFDLLDVPQVINHLAGARWCAENDDVWANMSLYRDTFGDGLWRNIPFDMNASWGQLYGGSNPLEATVDGSKSHPLYGGSSTGGNYNRLYDVIVRLPETRQMLLRRERSLLDQMVQPPETPVEARIIENHIRKMTNLISAEVTLDRTKWGASPWAPGKTFTAGIDDLINQFVVPRRRHWYVTHSITNTAKSIGIANVNNAGIPLVQPADAFPEFAEVDFNPVSGNQNHEYVALTNRSALALDLSGWTLNGAISFTFKPGTVIPSNSALYISPDVRQFRSRTTGPRGGQGLFVVGPYSGQLSARGEALTLKTSDGRAAGSWSYPGAESLAQRFLRVSELMYHPSALLGNPISPEAFEFIELRNISTTETLNLAGVRFTDGVDFTFPSGDAARLLPGARLIVVANSVAFAARYGSQLPVIGNYLGQLDNGGERLRILEPTGEEILDFVYKDGITSADGGGFSIEIKDEAAHPETWNEPSSWRSSLRRDGSPGTGSDPVLPVGAPLIVLQPVHLETLAYQPLTLSLEVTNTAVLPLVVELRRGAVATTSLPSVWITNDSHKVFWTLAGAAVAPPLSTYSFRITNPVYPIGIVSSTADITYLVDSDEDGLADGWETRFFGALNAQPNTDSDGDGLNNRDEQAVGSDPTLSKEAFLLEITPFDSGLILRFRMSARRTYSLQMIEALETSQWQKHTDFPAQDTHRVVELYEPPTSQQRLYRLVTPRQP